MIQWYFYTTAIFVNRRKAALDASFSCSLTQIASDSRHFGIRRIYWPKMIKGRYRKTWPLTR